MAICVCICITLIIISLIFAFCFWYECNNSMGMDAEMDIRRELNTYKKEIDSLSEKINRLRGDYNE